MSLFHPFINALLVLSARLGWTIRSWRPRPIGGRRCERRNSNEGLSYPEIREETLVRQSKRSIRQRPAASAADFVVSSKQRQRGPFQRVSTHCDQVSFQQHRDSSSNIPSTSSFSAAAAATATTGTRFVCTKSSRPNRCTGISCIDR